MSHVKKLITHNLIAPPKWLNANLMFEGITGSVSYGVCDDSSDFDIVGFCIPPKEMIFPHLSGNIIGFGDKPETFEQYQQHHVIVKEWRKEFDITIYGITKFFQLCMENNPNMVDALFLPRHCITHSTEIYEHVRSQRKLFLHKGSWHKFRGYAYSQLSKIKNQTNASNPKRAAAIEKFGFDTKFAYHVIRLLLQVEQILTEGNLELDRNAKVLRSVRDGEWSLERINDWFDSQEKNLNVLYATSTLQHHSNQNQIKQILLECLEMHYGSLDKCVNIETDAQDVLIAMQTVIDKFTSKTHDEFTTTGKST